jgi:TonB-dependent starch-binding outer membrane protein SusC
MLRGAVPGVQVIGKSIIIQGISTINASTDPLFVVDGLVVNSIDDVQPIEVLSVDILKGSAASIYGSRGSTGVILITLKGSSYHK